MIGVIAAPLFRDLPVQGGAADMMAHEMEHGMLEIPALGAPQVDIAVEKDAMNGWNVTVMTNNFTFTPERVGSENVDNTGHAHLYVDGIKIARLYSLHFHLPRLPVGDHEVSVSLSSNDHSYYMIDGNVISARATITEDETEMDTE
ncbi:hypothetical protein Z949_2500 [Sulfitobacter guttiformis KCTC 32187]|nr:hypothetical protein Z949_2500 [Sulfitobacter guttiformis KCTC 32187]